MTAVAIFVRVSKTSQDFNRQVHELSEHAKQRGYTIVATITEKISGAKRNKDRSAIKELMQLAEAKKIQKVYVLEVSRLGRKTSEILQVLEQLTEMRISVWVQNYNIETLKEDLAPNPVAQFLFTMLAEFARLERETLIERINSGLEEARRKGITLGRKKGSTIDNTKLLGKYKAVVRQLRAGKSVRDVASICEVGTTTVQKVKKALADQESVSE